MRTRFFLRENRQGKWKHKLIYIDCVNGLHFRPSSQCPFLRGASHDGGNWLHPCASDDHATDTRCGHSSLDALCTFGEPHRVGYRTRRHYARNGARGRLPARTGFAACVEITDRNADGLRCSKRRSGRCAYHCGKRWGCGRIHGVGWRLSCV